MPTTKPKNSPRNRWDDPKAIRRQDFAQGGTALGMSPAASLAETVFCQDLTEAYNRKRKRTHKAIHHIRIDDKGLKIPDVSFWVGEAYAEVVIEVDEQSSKALPIKKAKNAIEKQGVREAFVHCLDTGNWYRMDQLADGKASEAILSSWSQFLGVDLGKMVKRP